MLIALLALAALLLTGLVAVNVAYIRHLEAKDRRHDEQVGRLLQRIQAPEMAVMQHAQPFVQPDGDGHALTDEQMADRDAALRKVEELERDFAGRLL